MLSDVSPRHAPWSPQVALETIGAHAAQRGPLLPVLLALQETFGYVDPRAVPPDAKALNLSRADVHGVLTFYSDLRSTPPGKVRVQVCRDEAYEKGQSPQGARGVYWSSYHFGHKWGSGCQVSDLAQVLLVALAGLVSLGARVRLGGLVAWPRLAACSDVPCARWRAGVPWARWRASVPWARWRAGVPCARWRAGRATTLAGDACAGASATLAAGWDKPARTTVATVWAEAADTTLALV